ncbi:MAG: hypothetical protein ACE5HL_00415 [Terriglobia bacterium]
MKVTFSSTHKKVVVEIFGGPCRRGYVNPRRFDRPEGLELLDEGGQLQQLSWKKVKAAWFVRDWSDSPPRPDPTVFLRRPRLEGLWVRLHFRDNEILEGMLANNLLQLSPHGYLVTPPDLNGNHSKAFVPRTALTALEVLAVIPRRAERPHRRRPAPAAARQARLFTD